MEMRLTDTQARTLIFPTNCGSRAFLLRSGPCILLRSGRRTPAAPMPLCGRIDPPPFCPQPQLHPYPPPPIPTPPAPVRQVEPPPVLPTSTTPHMSAPHSALPTWLVLMYSGVCL